MVMLVASLKYFKSYMIANKKRYMWRTIVSLLSIPLLLTAEGHIFGILFILHFAMYCSLFRGGKMFWALILLIALPLVITDMLMMGALSTMLFVELATVFEKLGVIKPILEFLSEHNNG